MEPVDEASTSSSSKRTREEDDRPIDTKLVKIGLDSAQGSEQQPGVESVDDSTKSNKRDAAGWAKSRRKGKETSGKNAGRKSRRGTRRDEGLEEDNVKAPRLPKRQCALLIGFCGTGCNGMQMYVHALILNFV
jgi:tRNA pseudouridine38-40 synthase